jgi:MFS family permease
MPDSPSLDNAPVKKLTPERPLVVTVLGAVNTLLGILGILGAVLIYRNLLANGVSAGAIAQLVQENASLRHWLLGLLVLGVVASATLLFAGLGLLQIKTWAQKLTLYYAAGIIGLVIISLTVVLSYAEKLFPSINFSKSPAAMLVVKTALTQQGVNGDAKKMLDQFKKMLGDEKTDDLFKGLGLDRAELKKMPADKSLQQIFVTLRGRLPEGAAALSVADAEAVEKLLERKATEVFPLVKDPAAFDVAREKLAAQAPVIWSLVFRIAWVVLIGGLIYPGLMLWFLSRSSFLSTFNIDLTTEKFHVGTLTYTKIGLTTLFAWLLWGDFVWSIMEWAAPAILPPKLKQLGASNTLISVIMITLPAILNMTVVPWVSFKSDRHRGKWGRRIPFIVWTMPFLTICLILVGWSEDIGPWLQNWLPAAKNIAPSTMIVILLATFWVAFQFFNMFVNSVFWYLFNDVVPPQFLGRFMGLFRVATALSSAICAGLLYKYADPDAYPHALRPLLTGAALLYFFGFGLMCFRVKEGQYPPIEGEGVRPKGLMGFIRDVKIYGKESFSVRFYWYFFGMAALSRIAYALGIFNVFFNVQMGLTFEQMGLLGMFGGIITLLATYFVSVLVDRWHPLRITVYEKIFTTLTAFGGWIWLFVTLPGDLYFWLGLGGVLVYTYNYQLSDAAGIPLLMRLFPKSRYGQFSSATAMIRSIAVIIAGLIAGIYLDVAQKICVSWLNQPPDFAYRLIFAWNIPFNIIITILLIMAYRDWKRLGGDENYRPPAPWSPDGFEEVVDKVKSAPAPPRKTMLAMYIGLSATVINILLVLVFMHFMRTHGMMKAYHWHAWVFIPVKILLTSVLVWQTFSIWRDIRAIERGARPKYGVPHYGVFLVQNITGLLYFPVYWLQTIWMIKVGLERELIIFGYNALLMAVASLAIIQLIRWMEREPKAPPAKETKPAAEIFEPAG